MNALTEQQKVRVEELAKDVERFLSGAYHFANFFMASHAACEYRFASSASAEALHIVQGGGA